MSDINAEKFRKGLNYFIEWLIVKLIVSKPNMDKRWENGLASVNLWDKVAC